MLRPNFIGSKSLYLNPAFVSFTTAELALIGTTTPNTTVQPYAYTATVRDDYDAMNITIPTRNQAVTTRLAFGVFLSPENEKGNLIFQVSGNVQDIHSASASAYPTCSFFFGRKATNNTVVSSKAGANNDLAAYMLLPVKSHSNQAPGTTGKMNVSVETEVFSVGLSGGYVYCFGFYIDNPIGAGIITHDLQASLAMRKYSSELGVFRPSR